MKKYINIKTLKTVTIATGILVTGLLISDCKGRRDTTGDKSALKPNGGQTEAVDEQDAIKQIRGMPVYGNWHNFTTKDGLPGDKTYCVRIDGDRVWVGTHEGLALYENNKWKTYTTKDGLPHNGVLAVDVSKETGDVWIGTLSGLSRLSAGKFENFTQFNSGLANDLVYCVICDGKDVWVATGGGAGSYDTHTGKWGIYMERNAPMHEPWTYSVCEGDNKIFYCSLGRRCYRIQQKNQSVS